MADEENKEKDLTLWIMISIIIIIAIYITAVYIALRLSFNKSKSTKNNIIRSYPCYLNIILSTVIAINNLTRLITTEEEQSFACQLQAFILAVFDKLISTTITVNSYLTYRGLCDNEYYIEHIKQFFIITNSIGLFISILFGLIFTIRGTTYFKVCYVNGGPPKEIPDSILTGILFLIYLYCTLKTLLFLIKNIRNINKESVEREYMKTYSLHFYRMLLSLFLCSIFFLVTLLIINDSLFFPYEYIDLTFITLCLVIDLFYTLNKTVIKQTLICINKEKEDENDAFDDAQNGEQMDCPIEEDD